MQISSKLPGTGTNIFTEMSALAAQHQAVNLGQGFPDFDMSPELTGLVARAMRDGYNQYAPMAGWMPLREALSRKIGLLYNNTVDPGAEITITPGGSYALYTALTTILHPGDEVIVLEPCYDSYVPGIRINGAVPVPVGLELPGYRVNWDKVKSAITARTRAIMLNTPHNPTGTILSANDIEQLRSLVAGTSLLIVSDEVYEHLVYDGQPHQSMLRYPDLYARSLVCFSFGKVFHCTGWKLGYCVAPPQLTGEFRKAHQYSAFSTHAPAQVALAQYLGDDSVYLSLPAFFQEKRDFFYEAMKQTGFSLMPAAGSYFACASYEKISDEPAKEFVIRLTREAGVTAIPVSAFYESGRDDRTIRFCFGKKMSTLRQAADKLMNVVYI